MRTPAALVCLALGASGLAAQDARDFGIDVLGGYVRYDAAFKLENTAMGGARVNYYFTDHFGVAADLLFGGDQPIPGVPNSVMNPFFGGISLVARVAGPLYVLGGYSRLDYGPSAPYEFTSDAAQGGAGVRLFIGERFAFLLEARALYSPKVNLPGVSNSLHFVGLGGISFFERGGPAKDSDGDGVPDKKDACKNTPTGATVDARGCPGDDDKDAVLNGLDRCPDTPVGAKVDASGCPLDGDKDGVADGLDQCPDTPVGATVNTVGCPSDTDSDKVLDGLDKCADTPAGSVVDPSGCPLDEDKDTVPDGIDQCPGTPAGAKVDVKGCPLDADYDGVPDGIDQCPNTAAGERVDARGCPLAKDSDGDGVDDRIDQCPGTSLGTPVDAKGCTILFQVQRAPAPGMAPRPTAVLKGVTFMTGRSALTAGSYAVLDEVAASLVANPEINIEIAGYTDNTGSAAVNTRLSAARAYSVRAYLARKGVAPMRMTAKGYGPANPVATNGTPDGRALNRRVELHQMP